MRLHHTVNVAVGLNIVIQDEQGLPCRALIFPLILLAFFIPGLLYGWLQLAARSLRDFITILAPGGWREDLRLMVQALFWRPAHV